MDHQEQHHLHHQKEREHEKKEHKLHEQQQERQVRTIHPAWFVGIGSALIAIIILVWILVYLE
jgi:hypothetical protein